MHIPGRGGGASERERKREREHNLIEWTWCRRPERRASLKARMGCKECPQKKTIADHRMVNTNLARTRTKDAHTSTVFDKLYAHTLS